MNGVVGILLGTLASATAFAHHSYAMFDQKREVETEAIVRIWEFTNPHAKLWVYINDAKGTPVLWAMEAPGPQQLLRSGWDKNTVKPSDKIRIIYNPLHDGRAGGSLKSLTLADGRKMGMGGPPPAPAGGAASPPGAGPGPTPTGMAP